MSFVKVWDSLPDSSVNEMDVSARWLWVVILTMVDRYGNFHSTIGALTRRANLQRADVEAALDAFMAPDPSSTTPDDDGRRIISLGQNEWHVVNYMKYRSKEDPEAKREKARERKRLQRDREAAPDDDVTRCHTMSHDVTRCHDNAEAEVEVDKSVDAKPPASRRPAGEKKTRKSPKPRHWKAPGHRGLVFLKLMWKQERGVLPVVSWAKDGARFKKLADELGRAGLYAAVIEGVVRPPRDGSAEVTPGPGVIAGFVNQLVGRREYRRVLTDVEKNLEKIEKQIDEFIEQEALEVGGDGGPNGQV